MNQTPNQQELFEEFVTLHLNMAQSRKSELRKQELLKTIESINPNTAYGLYARGVYALIFNDYDQAIEKLEAALKLQKNFPIAHNDLAWAYSFKNDMGNAEREIHEAINQNKDTAFFVANLGFIQERQGKIFKAKAAYERAIEISFDCGIAHYYLGVLFRSNLRLYMEAEKELRLALQFSPEFIRAHAFLGLTLIQLKKDDEAYEILEEAYELEDEFWLTHLALGYLFARRGYEFDDKIFYNDAIVHLNKTVELIRKDKENPDIYFAYVTRGYVKAQMADYRAAMTDFKKAKEIDPTDMKLKRNLLRLKDAQRSGRISSLINAATILLGSTSFLAFLGLGWLFWQRSISDVHYGYIAFGFLVLSLVTLYLPQITKFKAGGVELELGKIESLKANPKFEI